VLDLHQIHNKHTYDSNFPLLVFSIVVLLPLNLLLEDYKDNPEATGVGA
jgi:hypothetical protein